VLQYSRFVVKHTETEATAVSPVTVMLFELVNFQLCHSHESLLTSVADVVFLGTVRQHVTIQARLQQELSLTDATLMPMPFIMFIHQMPRVDSSASNLNPTVFAREPLPSSVYYHMLLQVGSNFEPQATVRAAKWLIVAVYISMHLQTAIPVKSFATNGTLKWHATGVFAVVIIKIFLTCKTSPAFVTRKLLLCRMSFKVLLHSARLGEPSLADWTFVWFNSAMDSVMHV